MRIFLQSFQRNFFCWFFISLLPLGACGFQPLYQPASQPITEGANIEIQGLQDRIGQVVFAELSKQFQLYPLPSSKSYVLRIELNATENDQPLDRGDNTIRKTYVLTAKYQLLTDKQVILKESANSVTSFHLALSGYANYVSREEAQLRAAKEISIIIQQRLRSFLKAIHEN